MPRKGRFLLADYKAVWNNFVKPKHNEIEHEIRNGNQTVYDELVAFLFEKLINQIHDCDNDEDPEEGRHTADVARIKTDARINHAKHHQEAILFVFFVATAEIVCEEHARQNCRRKELYINN